MEQITLKTLPQATAQQVFDQAATHLLTQKKRSIEFGSRGETGRCLYRGHGGLKCVAGCFIADDEYNPRWEGKAWDDWDMTSLGRPETHRELISRLQTIHDDFQSENWLEELIKLAERRGLNTDALDNEALLPLKYRGWTIVMDDGAYRPSNQIMYFPCDEPDHDYDYEGESYHYCGNAHWDADCATHATVCINDLIEKQKQKESNG
jgi:hypothetical protein